MPSLPSLYIPRCVWTTHNNFIKKALPIDICGQPIHIIKEQYREVNDRFNEPTIINHIHEDGPFPGVIQLIHHEVVKIPEGTEISSGKRSKIRIIEKDWGTPFTDIRHILNFLVKHKDSPFMDLPTRDQHRIAAQTISSVELTESQREPHTISQGEADLPPPRLVSGELSLHSSSY